MNETFVLGVLVTWVGLVLAVRDANHAPTAQVQRLAVLLIMLTVVWSVTFAVRFTQPFPDPADAICQSEYWWLFPECWF